MVRAGEGREVVRRIVRQGLRLAINTYQRELMLGKTGEECRMGDENGGVAGFDHHRQPSDRQTRHQGQIGAAGFITASRLMRRSSDRSRKIGTTTSGPTP